MEQEFDEEDDVEHIRWMIEAFRDERYIRIKGRPLLTIYRPQDLPDPKRTVEIWRDECSRAGFPDPWLVGFETRGSVVDPADIGFDAGAQFVPHGVNDIVETTRRLPSCDPSNTVYDYADVAAAYVGAADPPWIRYPCVATGWDNTPRRRNGEALLLLGSTPDRYGAWLERAIRSQMRSEGGDGIVFVNAWNEWAEGAHLEPDADNGRAYLEVTRRVVEELGGSVPLPSSNEAVDDSAPTSIEDLYTDLYESFVLLQNRSSGYLAIANRRLESWRDFYNQELEKLREQNRTLASWCLSLDEQVEFLSGQRQTGEPP
jgi:hypothetical protein